MQIKLNMFYCVLKVLCVKRIIIIICIFIIFMYVYCGIDYIDNKDNHLTLFLNYDYKLYFIVCEILIFS